MLGLDARTAQPGVVLPAEAEGFRLVVDLGNGAVSLAAPGQVLDLG